MVLMVIRKHVPLMSCDSEMSDFLQTSSESGEEKMREIG